MAREAPTAIITSPPGYLKGVAGYVPVTTKDATGTLPEISNDHNVGLVISRPGFQPCLPFAHVVGCSEVCVPVTPADLQPTELAYQKEVDHAAYRVGAIHCRRHILQHV